MSDNMKQFVDAKQNIGLANAVIPDRYIIGGALNQVQNNPRVPFNFSVHAIDQPNGALILALSEEVFTDVRNSFMQEMTKMNPSYNPNIYRKLMDPLAYLQQNAEAVFGGKLTAVASAALPSYNFTNKEESVQRMMNYYNTFMMYEAQGGMETKANQISYQGYLVKYEGIKDGKKYTVLGGMDFKGIEPYCPNIGSMQGMMSYMSGGLFGRNTKKQNDNTPGSNVFGQGKPCDYIEWGAETSYYLVVPEENFHDAGNDYLAFVNSFQVDSNLRAQYDQARIAILDNGLQMTRMAQGVTQQNIFNNQIQQQKLTQMLNQNAQSISAGIMDSWNKKMASDSRISENFSQAIRGVNTYNTTDGRQVEVGVTADHVYQNQHGDVIGVSGNAIDQDVLNKINWTELKK